MTQHITFDGDHNIGIQAQGDGITVVVNRPWLQLCRDHRRQRSPAKELDLLDPSFRAIPLIGRERETADLGGWLDGAAAVSARCVIGRAGSGKTRLALELCAAAEAAGWDAGCAATSCGGSTRSTPWPPGAGRSRPWWWPMMPPPGRRSCTTGWRR